jgi:glucosyl-3-phosphoglycerate phosphatase
MHVNLSHSEWVTHSCNTGRPVSQLAQEFPHLDFNHLAEEWWHKGGPVNQYGIECEPFESLLQRVSDFRAMIAARPEQRIAVVGHGDFFHQVTGRFMNNCERVEMRLH